MHENTTNNCLIFAVGGGAATYILVTTLGGATEPYAICSWGWSCYVLAATMGGATEPYAFLYPSHHNNSLYPS